MTAQPAARPQGRNELAYIPPTQAPSMDKLLNGPTRQRPRGPEYQRPPGLHLQNVSQINPYQPARLKITTDRLKKTTKRCTGTPKRQNSHMKTQNYYEAKTAKKLLKRNPHSNKETQIATKT